MVIENVSFAELEYGNDIVFVPHIFKGNNDNGLIAKFIEYFGLLNLGSDSRFLDGGPMRILCTGDTYRYIIPFKIEEFCRDNNYKYSFKQHKLDSQIRRLYRGL